MLKIDSETMTISMTRGDTVDIIFSAVNEEGELFHPTRDVQLEIRNSETDALEAVDTIIGKTDTISPTLVLWGEVTKESE